MQHSNSKIRGQSTRNETRNSPNYSSKRSLQRPCSAKIEDRSRISNFFRGKSRSNSVRGKPENLAKLDSEEMEETDMEHKQGCPWQKARSRSRYGVGVSESSSGMIHPKPWGARNPTDIPCFCHMARGCSESSTHTAHRSTRQSTPNKSSKAKISDIVENFSIFLERRRIRITENELSFLVKKIEEKLQKFVDNSLKTSQSKHDQKDQTKKQKNVQTPLQRHQPLAPKSLSKEHLIELQKCKVPGQPNILGKLETKKYLLELTAEDQVPSNFRHILGNMNPTILHPDKMLIAMDDKQPAYLTALPDDLRHYSVKTLDNCVQLHHQAENTTLLLASSPNGLQLRRNTPVVVPKPHAPANYRPARRT